MDYAIKLKSNNKVIARVLNPERTNSKDGISSFYCAGMLIEFKESDIIIVSNLRKRTIPNFS